ncbi:MAG: divalent-cation tolerance protein CutA [Pseudomonadota bacterium]
MSDIRLLYVTAPDDATARTIARALVEERLAACCNLIPGARSVYRWKGEVAEEPETLLIVKTTADKAVAARDRALDLHPYETAAVIALDIDADRSAAEFCRWIAAETADA